MRAKKPDSCKECPLYESTEVPYSSGTKKDIMLVGQSPGREELVQKKPFVGESGKLLNRIFQKFNLVREEMFVANSLRCYEGPKALAGSALTQALTCCRPFLYRAITVVNPRLIVGMGNHALLQLVRKGKITEMRGKFYDITDPFLEPKKVFMTLHPAAVLRECVKDYPDIPYESMSNREKAFFMDFRTVGNYIESAYREKTIDTKGYRHGTFSDIKKFAQAKLIGWDVETGNTENPENAVRHYDPHTQLISMAFSLQDGKSSVFFADSKEDRECMKQILLSPSIKAVAARPFDENAAIRFLGIQPAGDIFDVLSIAQINDENYHRIDLEGMAELHANMSKIKSLAKGLRHDLLKADRKTIIEYNGVDADAALRVTKVILGQWKANAHSLWNYFRLFMMPVQNMLSEVSRNGCYIDKQALKESIQETDEKLHMAESSLIGRIPLRIRKSPKHLNKERLTRKRLVSDMVFGHLKCKPHPDFKTKVTKEPQVSAEHLKMFSSKHAWVREYLDWAVLYKLYSSYLVNLEELIAPNGYVYPSTKMPGTVTGRSSIVSPSIQNIPQRGTYVNLVRRAYIASPNFIMGARDLSQSELRIMGWIANERNILNAVNNKTDLHQLTASIVNSIPLSKVTKDMRQKAKGINFGLMYGMQAESLQEYLEQEYDIILTLEECEEIRNKFFRAYPMLPRYYEHIIQFCRTYGYVESPLGRRRRLPTINSPDVGIRLQAERQAINSPIQSFSSDLGFLGMALFQQEIKKKKLNKEIKLLFYIHDAIMFEAKEKRFKDAMYMLKNCMEVKAPKYIEDNFKVEVGYLVESEGKAGPNWAQLTKYTEV